MKAAILIDIPDRYDPEDLYADIKIYQGDDCIMLIAGQPIEGEVNEKNTTKRQGLQS